MDGKIRVELYQVQCRWKRQYVRLVESLPRTCMFRVLGLVSGVSCPWRLSPPCAPNRRGLRACYYLHTPPSFERYDHQCGTVVHTVSNDIRSNIAVLFPVGLQPLTYLSPPLPITSISIGVIGYLLIYILVMVHTHNEPRASRSNRPISLDRCSVFGRCLLVWRALLSFYLCSVHVFSSRNTRFYLSKYYEL